MAADLDNRMLPAQDAATHDRLLLTVADDAEPRTAEPRTTVEWRVPSGADPPPDD